MVKLMYCPVAALLLFAWLLIRQASDFEAWNWRRLADPSGSSAEDADLCVAACVTRSQVYRHVRCVTRRRLDLDALSGDFARTPDSGY